MKIIFFCIFIVIESSLHGFITKQHNIMAPFWLVSSIGRALHRYRRGHGFKSRRYRPEFFSGLILLLLKSVFITEKTAFIHIYQRIFHRHISVSHTN